MRIRHVFGPVLVATTLIAGCSGDEDADGASTSRGGTGGDPVSTTERTASDPSTTAVESTPSTASPSTTPTTEAPTTTLSVEEQVRAAMLAYYDFYWRCLRAPSECDPLEVAVPDSDAFRALTATRDDLVEGNHFVGPENVGYMVITAIEPAGDHTIVTTCWWSTAWLYFQPPIPNSAPTVQNNTPGTSVEAFQFVQQPDLTWKVRRADGIGEQIPNENRCPPEQ